MEDVSFTNTFPTKQNILVQKMFKTPHYLFYSSLQALFNYLWPWHQLLNLLNPAADKDLKRIKQNQIPSCPELNSSLFYENIEQWNAFTTFLVQGPSYL